MTTTVGGSTNRCCALALAFAVATFQPTTRAAASPDGELFEAINAAVEHEDYAEAARLLEEAYARDPQPTYLYSLGEVLLSADDCPRAIDAFDRYLATNPAEIDAQAARDRRATCPEPDPEPAPPPAVVTPPEPPTPRVEPTPRRPAARDPVFLGLGSAGLLLSLTGAGVLVGTRIAADDTNRVATEGGWESGIARTRTLATTGTVVLAVGGTLLAGAVIRLLTRRRAVRESD